MVNLLTCVGLTPKFTNLCGTDMRSELACVGLIPKFTKLHGTGTKGEVARGAFYTKYFSLVRDESACRSID